MPKLFSPTRRLVLCLGLCLLSGTVAIAARTPDDPLADIARFFSRSSPTDTQVGQQLRALAAATPLVSVASLGQTHEGRPIWQATVTDPAYRSADKIRLFIIARQHGTEQAGTVATLGLLEYLARSPSATVRELLRYFEISMVPMVISK